MTRYILKYALAGLVIPIIFLVIFALREHSHYWKFSMATSPLEFAFWPTSIGLLDFGTPPYSLSVYRSVAYLVGLNVVIYAVIGVMGWYLVRRRRCL